MGIAPIIITTLADASSAASVMRSYVTPVMRTLCVLAALVSICFLVTGGLHYMASGGKPDKLDNAKLIIRNALLGLVIVFTAGTLTAILAHAYGSPAHAVADKFPTLNDIKPDNGGGGLVGVLIRAITGVLNNIIQSAAEPFLKALNFFTTTTPLIADNSGVFNLWLIMLGIADVLFMLVVALLGFHVMSFASLGLDEIEFKHLLPRLSIIFLLMNSSVFVIDSVISLSNVMIKALQAGFTNTSVWDVLTAIVKQSSGMGLVVLLIMMAFLILAIILLIYYVGRIVTIYLGAVVSPLVLLVWLIPGFRDFSETATKTYLVTIFVLFVHVVILQLAASIFSGMSMTTAGQAPDPLMSIVVGIATLIALCKTQGVMNQLSYVSVGPRTARQLGGQFMNGFQAMRSNGGRASAALSANEGRPQDQGYVARNNSTVIHASGADKPFKTGLGKLQPHEHTSQRTKTPDKTKPSGEQL